MRRRHDARGFALAAVLWLLAGLAVVVASVSRVTLTSAQRVAQLRQRADFVQSAYGTRAHLLYWLSGTGTDGNSFTDDVQRVRADGIDYQAQLGSTVRLQDTGGLLTLNAPPRALLANYLASCGVESGRIAGLLDTLEDYTDADDLVRTQGAEREEYAARSLPPPRNAPLLSVSEVWRVMDWSAVRPVLEAHRCEQGLTAEPALGATINLATAPPPVLRAAGVPEDVIRNLDDQGRDDPVALQATLSRLIAAAGRIDELGAAPAVLRTLRVIHRQADGGPWRLEYTLRLTPDSEGRPWQIVEPDLRALASEAQAAAPPVDSAAAPSADPSGTPPAAARILPWPDAAPAHQISHVKKLFSF